MTDELPALESSARLVNVAGNEVFKSRISVKQSRVLTVEQKLWRDCIQAATELHFAGYPANLDSIHARLRGRWAKKSVTELLQTEKWEGAMQRRGVPWNAERDTLTPLQQSFLTLYFDTSVRATHSQKLRQAGVSAEQFRGWMRTPVFAREMEKLRQAILQDGFHLATQRLIDLADAGDLHAIDRVMAFNGDDFRTLTGEDVAGVLAAVFEVLDEAKIDPKVMTAIAARVSGTRAGVAAMLSANTVVVPEVTP